MNDMVEGTENAYLPIEFVDQLIRSYLLTTLRVFLCSVRQPNFSSARRFVGGLANFSQLSDHADIIAISTIFKFD